MPETFLPEYKSDPNQKKLPIACRINSNFLAWHAWSLRVIPCLPLLPHPSPQFLLLLPISGPHITAPLHILAVSNFNASSKKARCPLSAQVFANVSPSAWNAILSFVPSGSSLKAQQVKNLPAVQGKREMGIRSLGLEDPLEGEMATHSCILACESHGQRSLVGYSPQGCKESDTTDWLSMHVPPRSLHQCPCAHEEVLLSIQDFT